MSSPAEIITNASKTVVPESGILENTRYAYSLLGMYTPITRGIGTTVAAYLALSYMQPGAMYIEGQKRPWSVSSDHPEAVFFTPAVAAVLLGVLASGV